LVAIRTRAWEKISAICILQRFHYGQRLVNVSREFLHKKVVETYAIENKLVELTGMQGIQSTHGVTYNKYTAQIINHVYLDVDRTIGLEIRQIVSGP